MSPPLSGYRVLEVGSTVAGPFCGRLLADFGAEVIKVEPAEGDAVRTMGKRFKGESLYAASIFRNKALISVDLHTDDGHAPDEDLGGVTMAGVVPRLSAAPGKVHHAGHRLGEDTDRVLREVPGMSPGCIEALAAAGIMVCGHRRGESPLVG